MDSLIKALQQVVGKPYVLTSPAERLVYECDACLLVKAPPEVVVLPKTTVEVSAIVQLCQKHNVPYVARGGGTGLSGGALAITGGVIIGLNRMDCILNINPDDFTATVEAGVVNGWLNEALEPYGLFFAPDPSSQSASTIGGNLAENAGGIHCVKYGVTTDHVLAVEVVLPNGEVVWLGGKNRRRHNHGYNLTGLMVGSEGTLGIITRAVLRLLPKPPEVRVYLVAFKAVAHATDAVSEIIAAGLSPAALEFMDAFTVKAVNAAFQVGFPETSRAVLLAELDGTPDRLVEDEARLLSILKGHGADQIRVAHDAAERKKLWAARKGAVAAYGRILPAFYLHDCVIPRSRLTEVLETIENISKEYDLTVGNVFHAGDGNLHPNILFDPADKAMVKRVLAGGEAILKACLAAGGTLTGEHGVGLEKSQYMPWLFSSADLARMLDIKAVFDPSGLANPEKIFPTKRGCGETHGSTSGRTLDIEQPLLADGEVWI